MLLWLPNAERRMKIGVPVARRRESRMFVNKFESSCRPWRTCSVLSCILIGIKTFVKSYSVLCSFAPRASCSWVCVCVLFPKTGIPGRNNYIINCIYCFIYTNIYFIWYIIRTDSNNTVELLILMLQQNFLFLIKLNNISSCKKDFIII